MQSSSYMETRSTIIYYVIGFIIATGIAIGLFAISQEPEPKEEVVSTFHQAALAVHKTETKINKPPVKEIVATPIVQQIPVSYGNTVTMTAYAPGDGSGGYAADGTAVYYGMAACPYSLSFGTQFRVLQNGEDVFGGRIFTCHDRSATAEGLLDIWVESTKAAFAIGRQQVTMEIL